MYFIAYASISKSNGEWPDRHSPENYFAQGILPECEAAVESIYCFDLTGSAPRSFDNPRWAECTANRYKVEEVGGYDIAEEAAREAFGSLARTDHEMSGPIQDSPSCCGESGLRNELKKRKSKY